MSVPKQARSNEIESRHTQNNCSLFAESTEESDEDAESESEEREKKKKKKPGLASKVKPRKGKKEGMYMSGNVCSQASKIKRDIGSRNTQNNCSLFAESTEESDEDSESKSESDDSESEVPKKKKKSAPVASKVKPTKSKKKGIHVHFRQCVCPHK